MVKLFFPGHHSVPATMQILNPDGQFILWHPRNTEFGDFVTPESVACKVGVPPRPSPLGPGDNHILPTHGEFGMVVQRLPGGGNGKPLQYSCLGNPMDRGAWRATVHGVTRVGHNWVAEHMRRLRNGEAALREAGGGWEDMKVKGKFAQSCLNLCSPMEFPKSGWGVDFPALSEFIDVRRPPWPREGMIMHTLTALSTLWGDPSPWALTLEKNLNITCKENFPYPGGV